VLASTVEGWGMEDSNANVWWGYPLIRGKKYVMSEGVLVVLIDEYESDVVASLYRVKAGEIDGLELLSIFAGKNWNDEFIEYIKKISKGGV
jgi:hypothetical protein